MTFETASHVAPGLDALPFNWRLVAAVALNVALWSGMVVALRQLTG